MATKTWSSTDGNWGAAGSWTPSGVPVSSDVVIFPRANYQAVTSGLDQSAVDLDLLMIEVSNFSKIGLEGTPLQIAANLIHHKGRAELHLTPVTRVDVLVVEAENWEKALQLEDMPVSTILYLTVLKGKVTAYGSSVGAVNNIEIGYSSNPNDAIVDFSGIDTSQHFGTLRMNSGKFKGNTNSGYVVLKDGLLIADDGSGGALTELVQSGGIFDWQNTETITAARLMGGIMSSQDDLRPKTITDLLVFPGAIALLPDNVTVTTGGLLVTNPP